MEIFIGILLIISFIGLAIYAIRGGNLLMGMIIMAVIWTALPLLGFLTSKLGWTFNKDFYEQTYPGVTSIWEQIKLMMTNVFTNGPEGWGPTLVNVIFGAWFGRVILQTGIANTLIKKTTELGGDRPAITCILLSLVTTAIFSSLFGAGAVVAIGVIVLPILMSLGISKKCALISYTLSIGSGMFINPVLNKQYQLFFPDFIINNHLAWGFSMMGIQVLFTIILILILSRKKAYVSAYSAPIIPNRPIRKKLDFAPTISLIAPILPVVLNLVGLPLIFGFLFSGFYALIVCKKIKSFKGACKTLNKDFFDGIVDAAPLIGFLLVLPMFNSSASLCAPYFKSVLGGIIPNNALVIVIIFIILSAFGMFRGPLTLFGCGAALLSIISSVDFIQAFSNKDLFLAPLFIIPSTVMNVSLCMTQSWVAWGLGYTKVPAKNFIITGVISGYVICTAMQLVSYFVFFR